MLNKITRANKQLERLTTFLAALEINASDIHLCITDSALAQLSSIQPVVLSDDDIDDEDDTFNKFDRAHDHLWQVLVQKKCNEIYSPTFSNVL